jgi:hypothetical protein
VTLLVIQSLIFFKVLDCDEILEEGSSEMLLSLVSTCLSIFGYGVLKRLDMRATNEDFVILNLEEMSANISWLPYSSELTDFSKACLFLDYGNISTDIGGVTSLTGVTHQVKFQFNENTIQTFIDLM